MHEGLILCSIKKHEEEDNKNNDYTEVLYKSFTTEPDCIQMSNPQAKRISKVLFGSEESEILK